MKDKSLFPTKVKNMIAISELVNDDKLKDNLKQISKKRSLYRSIMIALGRDFSDAISRYIINDEKNDLLKNFSNEQIQKMLKENIPVKKLVKITEPNAEEKFEQISLIFEDNSVVVNNENDQPLQDENMRSEELKALMQESEDFEEQADSLSSIDDLESDIPSNLNEIIAQLQGQVKVLAGKLQEAEEKIDDLVTIQKNHHNTIKKLIDAFKSLTVKVDRLRNFLK
jgi:DNA repair ATPase RecN